MISVSVVGASGYVGGELIRLLLNHPMVKINQVTSDRYFGKYIKSVHPNLRGISNHKFTKLEDLENVELIFSCLPHGLIQSNFEFLNHKTDRIIDLSADFRLKSERSYKKWYVKKHQLTHLLDKFVYGIPEIYREKMQNAKYISSAGCNATAILLALYPLYKNNMIEIDKTVIEVKVGTSEAGNKFSQSTHYPERVRSLRSYKPTGHRHIAEITQELQFFDIIPAIHMSATSVEMVRGVLATSHVFLKPEYENITDKDLWQIYRKQYKNDPFIRIIKEKSGNYRYPDPKTLIASNYCDIGFEIDQESNRVVIISAIDNLMKGAAGQAVQAFNIMYHLDETEGLKFPGIYLY